MGPKKEAGVEAAPRRHKDIVDRQLVRDARLSFRALGVAIRLLSNAPGFKMTSIDLARERPEGRDAIRNALKELEVSGYLSRHLSQLPNGQWVTRMVITDASSPTPENPSSAPTPGKPTPGKPAIGFSGLKSSKGTIRKSSNRKNTTTTTTEPELFWPPALTAHQAAVVSKVIHGLDQSMQQQLLDELAGALRSPRPPRQLASWMLALRVRLERGEFLPDLGLAIEQERARRTAEAAKQQERNEEQIRRNSAEVRERSAAAYQRASAEIQRRLDGPPDGPSP